MALHSGNRKRVFLYILDDTNSIDDSRLKFLVKAKPDFVFTGQLHHCVREIILKFLREKVIDGWFLFGILWLYDPAQTQSMKEKLNGASIGLGEAENIVLNEYQI